MKNSLRLFVAVYPPPQAVAKLLALANSISALPAGKPTPLEQVHRTLVFLGEVNPCRLDDTVQSVQRSCAGLGPFSLGVESLSFLPTKGPRRLLAAFTSSPPQLLELQRRLSQRLARNPRARDEERFNPHLTLRRFHPAVGIEACPPLPVIRGDNAGQPCGDFVFEVREISLVRSVISYDGAEHRTLERCSL